uniref:Uncharacterized protein n=1 Tax=Ciona intestinalis TaxID=7719 RepID=H2XNE2_CIOIN
MARMSISSLLLYLYAYCELAHPQGFSCLYFDLLYLTVNFCLLLQKPFVV